MVVDSWLAKTVTSRGAPWLPLPGAKGHRQLVPHEAHARDLGNVMAVDYFHRLLGSGKRDDVRALRDEIYRRSPRTIAGETWWEIVPFSFAKFYELAPAARRVEAQSRASRRDRMGFRQTRDCGLRSARAMGAW